MGSDCISSWSLLIFLLHLWHSSRTQLDSNRSTYVRHNSHRLQRLLVGRSIILYSQRTIKVLIKLSGMICTFIVGISQKWESVILILILFGTYDIYIMVYKSSNYKQWPGIVFWYSQIQNPVQTKIKTLKYFNYITLSSTDLFFFCNFLIIYMYVYTFESNQLGKPSF